MQLVSIEAQGFKKLRNFKASFTEGLNVIVGDNAAGKSTLLQAIECALYGATVVPGKKEHLITWGQKSWKVTLHFVLDGAEYLLTRSKSTAKLERSTFDGDELVANGNTPVTAAVVDLLDLDAKDYNLFMQSKQGETSGVLTFGAAALDRKVEQFAGISLVDRVQSLAQEEYRTAKAEADANEVPGEQLESQESECVELNDTLHAAEESLKAAQETLNDAQDPDTLPKPSDDPDALQARLTTLRRLQGQVERANVEVDNAKRRYDEARQRFEDLEEPEPTESLEARLSDLQKQVRPAAKRVDDLQQELANLQQLFNQLYEAEQEMDDQSNLEDMEDKLPQLEARQEELHKRRRAEQDHVVGLNQRIRQLQSLRKDANCPTCGTRLSEHDPERLEAEVIELAEQRTQVERRVNGEMTGDCQEIDAEVAEMEKAIERARNCEARVDKLRDTLVGKGVVLHTGENPVEGKLAEAKETHEGLLSEKFDVETRLEKSEGEWSSYRRAERAVKTEYEHLREAQESREELEAQLEAADAKGVPTEERIQELRSEWSQYFADKSTLHEKRQAAQHAVAMAKQGHSQAQERLQHAQRVLDGLRSSVAKSREAAKAADQAGRVSRFLRERRAGYLQEVWDAVLGAASKQVRMASSGMVTRLVYDDGDFLFEEEGILAPVASASGAQKAHIGVALRVGLSRALYGSNALLIFDEPTESMREHHAMGLTSSLAGASSQCLLITHREQDQDLASNVVEVG